MTSPVVFVALGTLNPAEADAYQSYAGTAGPLLKEAGGRPRARMKVLEHLVGDPAPKTVMMMEFDSADAIRDVLASPAYQALVPLRDRAFTRFSFFIAEDAG